MRKIWFMALAAVLVVAFAAPSFSAETTFSGSYRVRSVMDYNFDKKVEDAWNPGSITTFTPPGYGGPNHPGALYTGYFDQRFSLSITHKRSEFLRAVVSIDLIEDVWGQGRAGRVSYDPAYNEGGDAYALGMVKEAYIEALTPIGLFTVGTKLSRWGMGTYTDRGGSSGDPGVSWGVKFGDVIMAVAYTKYRDSVQDYLGPLFGWAYDKTWTDLRGAGFLNNVYTVAPITTYPGRIGLDAIGGMDSLNYNSDLDAYTFTVLYITDKFRTGAILNVYNDKRLIPGAGLLKGPIGFVNFNGESPDYNGYFAQGGLYSAWPTPFGFGSDGPGLDLWTVIASQFDANYGAGAFAALGFPGPAKGLGRAGMYAAMLYHIGYYWDLAFFDGQLKFTGEVNRIFGGGNINGMGRAYNQYLNWYSTANAASLAAFANVLATMAGKPEYATFARISSDYRLPEKIGVDGLNVYTDLTYYHDLFTVGASFLYGSGEAKFNGLVQKHFNFNNTGVDDFAWSNIIFSGNQKYLASTGAPLGLGDNQENVMSAKLHWSVTPMEKLDVHGAFIWARYTNEVGRGARDAAGNLVHNWNAFYGHPMNYVKGDYTYTPAALSADLGWEIDAGLTYEIMEGLSLNSEFGVLFTGSAFDYRNEATGGVEHWGPIYRWVNTLTYQF